MKKLISELKVGDIVKHSNRWGDSLEPVTKVTNCFVEVSSSKFKKIGETSQSCYEKYTNSWIETLTEQEITDFQHKEEIEKRRRKLAECKFNGLSEEVINEVYEIVFKK